MIQVAKYTKQFILLSSVIFISNCGGGDNRDNPTTGNTGNLINTSVMETVNNETDLSSPPQGSTLSETAPHLIYPTLWNYEQINLQDALDYVATTTRSTSKIRIAIIDSGRTEHPDIPWARENGQIIDADFSGGIFDPIDSSSAHKHGTHVAGIIGGFNFRGQGRVGICPDCEILSVKVGKTGVFQGGYTDETIAAGIDFAVANQAQVINISIANPGNNCTADSKIKGAIARAITAGITVVAAVGNYGNDDASNITEQFDASNSAPASCPDVISVGASDQSGDIAIRYSNKGSAVIGTDNQPQLDINGRALSTMTLIAPGGGAEDTNGLYGMGVDCPDDSVFDARNNNVPTSSIGIFSTHYVDYPQTACYRYLSGTSMATPHVAGVVGLMLSVQPGLSPKQIKDILMQTTTDVSDKPHCGAEAGYCGSGLLNAYDAVLLASDTEPTTPPTPASNGPCAFAPKDTTCSIDAIAYNMVDANDFTEEVVFAYGKRWKFNADGDVLEAAIDLKDIHQYGANTTIGPCSGLFNNQDCTIDSATILHHHVLGYVESVTAGSSGWNFDQNGNQWPASNFSLDSIDRYAAGPCSEAMDECFFDTRTLTDARSEWGGYAESITANGRYYLYDFDGNFLASDLLTNVKRYGTNGFSIGGSSAGPCTYAPAGELCHFDAREFKRVDGKLIEVIIAYGRYWEFEDQNDIPLVAGSLIENIARFR